MKVVFTDFNQPSGTNVNIATAWNELQQVLTAIPLNLKESDQRGIQGKLIFDPVGTNFSIKEALTKLGWHANLAIPNDLRFLGTDVDFVSKGVLVEVQFSNYPFLLNNLLRSELFCKGSVKFGSDACNSLILITKGHMFPASNSTLYYEQAVEQVSALLKHDLFSLPMRIVGLLEETDIPIPCNINRYANPRYSRELSSRDEKKITIESPNKARSRCSIKAYD